MCLKNFHVRSQPTFFGKNLCSYTSVCLSVDVLMATLILDLYSSYGMHSVNRQLFVGEGAT